MLFNLRNIYRSLITLYRNFKEQRSVPIKLDIHIVEHCNLNCKGCTHYSSIASPELINPQLLEEDLKKISILEKDIGIIQLLGGEPLLHPKLPEILLIVRKYFKTQKINLITNGLLLNDVNRGSEFFKIIRETHTQVRITKYPIKIDYNNIFQVCKKNKLNFNVFADRSDSGKGWHLSLLDMNGGGCWAYRIKYLRLLSCKSKNCLQLSRGKIFPCSRVAHSYHLNKYFKTKFEITSSDYIEVKNIEKISQLRKLMVYSTPFCNYCVADPIYTKWSRTSKDISEWVRK